MSFEIRRVAAIREPGSGHTRTWLENECLTCGLDDYCFFARGSQRDLARMKETEDTDADILGDCLGMKDQSEEQKEQGSGQHAANPPNCEACGPR